jgi:XTP/dITP diphosphohydrolase
MHIVRKFNRNMKIKNEKKLKKIITLVTGNQSKLMEAIEIAKKYPIKIVGKKLYLPEIMEINAEKIIIEKAKYAFKKIKKPLIVDDSGIYFEAYPNFPGVFTKFIIKLLGFDGIFKLLKGKTRGAYFQCTICFIESNLQKPILFKGICKGRIAEKISNIFDLNSEFNSIFIPEGENRTFSEMTIEERKKFSHRRKALEKFLKWYITKHV